MQYYTLYLEWSTFYKLCFLVDHSFPSVVFPFVNPTKYSLFSFYYSCNSLYIHVIYPSIPINHCVIFISYKLYNKFYVNVYFVKYFIPLLLMEINSNWIELNTWMFIHKLFREIQMQPYIFISSIHNLPWVVRN